ncbi:MAG: hypothetical protein Q9227_005601 [Pyrenula ochraceoflavens]
MPSRSKKSQADEPPFLFVRESPANPKTSNTNQTTRSKQRHVQRLFFARKKKQALLSVPSQTCVPPTNRTTTPSVDHDPKASSRGQALSSPSFGIHSGSSILDLRVNVATGQHSKHIRNDALKDKSDESLITGGFDTPSSPQRKDSRRLSTPPSKSDDSEDLNYCSCDTTWEASLQMDTPLRLSSERTTCWLSMISDDHFDPFRASAVPIDESAHTLISYYMLSIIPSMFRADSQHTKAKKSNQSRHMPALFEDIRACITDQAHFYSLLTSSASRMQRAEDKLLIPNESRGLGIEVVNDLKGHAIQALRSRLQDGHIDDLMVQDVYRLFAAETMSGNLLSAQIHLQALIHMVEVLGGLEKLSAYTMERVILADIFAAVQQVAAPKFPLDWDPGNLPQLIIPKTRCVSESPVYCILGKAFFAEEKDNVFHHDILSIFSDLIPLVHASIASWKSATSMPWHQKSPGECEDNQCTASFGPSDMHYLLLRRTAIEHRLLSFSSTKKAAGRQRDIGEACRLTALLFIGMVLADPMRKKLTGGILTIIMRVLQQSGSISMWYPHTDLLLWVCSLASFAAEEADETAYYTWFGALAAELSRRLNIASVASLRSKLKGYFYLDDTHQEAASRLWRRFWRPSTGKPDI